MSDGGPCGPSSVDSYARYTVTNRLERITVSTFGEALEWHASDKPTARAVIDRGQEYTYEELWSRVCKFANALSEMGLGREDRIGILAHNSHEYLESYLAMALISAAAVPINPRSTSSEVEYILTQSDARALIVEASLQDKLERAKPSLDNLGDRLIVIGADQGDSPYRYEALLDSAASKAPRLKADPEACLIQGYTAGTTGFPKGVVKPHGRVVDGCMRMIILYSLSSDDVELVAAPLFHGSPSLCALAQLFIGGTVVLTRASAPAQLLSDLAESRCTWAFMVPSMWQSLVKVATGGERYNLESMRLLVSGGQHLRSHTRQALVSMFPSADLNEFYGATELGLVTNISRHVQGWKEGSVGRPVFGYHLQLRDDSGNEVAVGEPGEIFVRGPISIREYYSHNEDTANAFDGDWITLGDVGRLDEEGYLYIVDRKTDMIITGGENVFPNEIETVIHSLEGVENAVVVGVPDDQWGEAIKAVVVRCPGSHISESDIVRYCRDNLANYKVPKSVDFVESLPLSGFGKVLRRKVRELYDDP